MASTKNSKRREPEDAFQDLLKKLSAQFQAQVKAKRSLQQQLHQVQRKRYASYSYGPDTSAGSRLRADFLQADVEEKLAAEANEPVFSEEMTQDEFEHIVAYPSEGGARSNEGAAYFSEGVAYSKGSLNGIPGDLDWEGFDLVDGSDVLGKIDVVEEPHAAPGPMLGSNVSQPLGQKGSKTAAVSRITFSEDTRPLADVSLVIDPESEEMEALGERLANRAHVSHASRLSHLESSSRVSSRSVQFGRTGSVDSTSSMVSKDFGVYFDISAFPDWFNPAANKAKTTVRRSQKDSFLKELSRPKRRITTKADFWILSPLGRKRLLFDILWVFALFIEAWITPFDLVFMEDGYLPDPLVLVAYICLTLFFLDIILNFFTGYIENGEEILQRSLVIMRYLRFWFWFDLFVTIPWDEILSFDGAGSSSTARASRALRFQKMVRILRLVKVFRYFKKVEQKRDQSTIAQLMRDEGPSMMDRFTKFMARQLRPLAILLYPLRVFLFLIFSAHLHGVIWAWLRSDWAPTTSFDVAMDRYYESLWFAFSMFTFGTPPSGTTPALWTFEMILLTERMTMVFVAMTHVIFQSLVTGADDATHALRSHYAREYLQNHDVSTRTQIQMLFSVNETGKMRKMLRHFGEFLDDGMPHELCRQIREELWAERLLSLGLFGPVQEWDFSVISDLCQAISEEYYASGVILFKEGDSGGCAYMVLIGSLLVAIKGADIPPFTQNMWLGERSLINSGLRRTGTCISQQVSSVMRVPATEFHDILANRQLLETFHNFISAELWKGLCGRCGIMGDHFAHECPRISKDETAQQNRLKRLWMTMRTRSLNDLDKVSQNTGKGLARDLQMYLAKHENLALNDVLARLGIKTFDELLERREEILNAVESYKYTPDSSDDNDGFASRNHNRLPFAEHASKMIDESEIQAFQDGLIKATMKLLKERVEDGHYFAFLSHYKAEAGTEATLMRGEMEILIQDDSALSIGSWTSGTGRDETT